MINSVKRAFLLRLLVCSAICLAQEVTPPEQAETTTRDEAVTFRVRSNLVLVPVVVRDQKNNAVGDLKREDFQLFDRGKAQVITKFSMEKQALKAATAKAKPSDALPGETPSANAIPERFTAFVFDDLHMKFEDLVPTRDAAGRRIDALEPTARAGIYTTSGRVVQDFTDDRAKLRETLRRVQPWTHTGLIKCPDVGYYQADLIINKEFEDAINAGIEEAFSCLNLDRTQPGARLVALNATRVAARQVLTDEDQNGRLALGSVRTFVRRLAAMPGQRNLILVSPGFLTTTITYELSEAIDQAVRSNVMINALDARGLYVEIPGGDASKGGITPAMVLIAKTQYEHLTASLQSEPMAAMAEGTGGRFFQNSNDLDAGFKLLAALPEYRYVLGFSPDALKSDGSYHALKVTVKGVRGVTVRARRGYFAPKGTTDPAQAAKQEIEDALFSREEIKDIPVHMQTQFFKINDTDARLSVLARVEAKGLHYRKAEGRNRNELTIVSALFDRQGNYIKAVQKVIEMRLRDATLESPTGPPIAVKSSFDVKPGTYVVRLIVRDAEGQMMAAENGVVDIPY